jgi:hypothetical protein
MGMFNRKREARPDGRDSQPLGGEPAPPSSTGLAVPSDPELVRIVDLLNGHSAAVGSTNQRIREARRRIARAGGSPSYPEYVEDLISEQPSRTDAAWQWLLDVAVQAAGSGHPEITAAIGQFVDFVHGNGVTFDTPVDLADVRLWPMSPRLLVPFCDVVLPAVDAMPRQWRLLDGSGDSIDRAGLLLLWSLAEEELVGTSPDASRIAARVREERGVNVHDMPAFPSLTRRVMAEKDRRDRAETTDRGRAFAGCRDYAAGLEALARDNPSAAVGPLTAAARAGHDQAAYQGGFAADDQGDQRLVRELWGQAARADIAPAALNYAFRLHDDGDLHEARRWFERAGQLGDNKGYGVLTALDMDDPPARRKWARLGAEAGNAACMGQLAACLYQDSLSPSGPDQALLTQARLWGERGGQLGDDLAMFFAGAVAALQGDRVKARDWLIRAHQAGNDQALDFLRRFDL